MREEWEEDWARLEEHLVRRVLPLVRDHTLAKDVVQEAFKALLEVRMSGGMQNNVEAWLVTVATRKAIDAIRRRKVENKRLSQADADAQPSPVPTPSIFDGITQAQLEAALAKLPEAQRRAIVMWMHGAKLREIAADQSTSVATAHRNVQRALQALRKALSEHLPDEEDEA